MAGGLTVGAMLIPQCMAYAELAGMPPQYGFYAAIGPLVVYALVGTSRHLGVGPEPGTAILAATGVGAVAAGDPERYVTLMATLALLVGAICLVGALARLGFVASLLSKPVLVGYITGVGLTLVSSQLGPLTGLAVDADGFFTRIVEVGREGGDLHGPTLVVGSLSLVLVLVLRWRTPQLPGGLIAVAASSVVVAALGLTGEGLAVVGDIPAGLPKPRLPSTAWSDLVDLMPVAAGIALVGFTDNLLTSRSIAGRKGYRVDANRELLSLGLINVTAGVSQGFPVSSSASRTAVPASLGSRTQLVSLVGAAFVVLCLTGLSPVLEEIPRTALAAVIIAAGLAIVDVGGFRSLWRVDRGEAALAAVTTLTVLFTDVLVGVLVAVVLSVLVAGYRIARPHDAVLGDMPGLVGWVDLEMHADARTEAGLLVYRFDAPLFFLNAERFRDRVQQVLEENPGPERWLVLDFEGVGDLDATAVDVLVDLVDDLGVIDVVAVARANLRVLDTLGRAGLLAPDGPLIPFATINSAVRTYRERFH